MRFSDLTLDFRGATNALYERVHELKARQADLIDLVHGNVHEAGIFFPEDILRDVLQESTILAREYRPDSLGQSPARAAIAAYEHTSPDQILITPGTSVSYWFAFRLLANPGDEILCPVPSYPLFDYIARMCGIELTHYQLDEQHGWQIDFDDLEAQIGSRTRAVVLISPHNPTGMVVDAPQGARLEEIARNHDIGIISDEVFREFTFSGTAAGTSRRWNVPLAITLNGFSKMFALPGMKIGWMSVSGDDTSVGAAMKTLEMISDTFLPVNEIAQFAVAGIFERGKEFLRTYRSRIQQARDDALRALGPGSGVIPPEGGFYCVLPFGREIDDEDLAIELVTEEQVLVHPGYFYEIGGRHVVFSFVGKSERVLEGLHRIRGHLT